MDDLEHEIEQDRSQTVQVTETRRALDPRSEVRCVCGGIATRLFEERIGTIILERRLYCENCDHLCLMIAAASDAMLEARKK